MSIPFTGTGIRWVTSKDPSHGIADVYLDDAKVSTVDLYAGSKQNQVTGYEVRGLPAGAHTLKIVVTGQKNAKATGPFVVVDAVDLLSGSSDYYPVVPQQAGTGITLNGRQSKIVVAGYDLGRTRMQYSTSEIMTNAAIGGRDLAVLYGDEGGPGETVLRFAQQPTVQVLGGSATSTWDAARGDLRLNYTHDGLTRVLVTAPGQRPLLLLLADKATAATFWRQDTAAGPVLVRGTHLVRTAADDHGTLALTGDTGTDGAFEVFAAEKSLSWNGSRVATQPTPSGSLTATAPTAKAGDPARADRLEAPAGVAGEPAGLRRLGVAGGRQADHQQLDGARHEAGALRRRLRLPHRQHVVPRPVRRATASRPGSRCRARAAARPARSRRGSTASSSAARPTRSTRSASRPVRCVRATTRFPC